MLTIKVIMCFLCVGTTLVNLYVAFKANQRGDIGDVAFHGVISIITWVSAWGASIMFPTWREYWKCLRIGLAVWAIFAAPVAGWLIAKWYCRGW